MIREVPFETHSALLEQFRASCFGQECEFYTDEFDHCSHHYVVSLDPARDSIDGIFTLRKEGEAPFVVDRQPVPPHLPRDGHGVEIDFLCLKSMRASCEFVEFFSSLFLAQDVSYVVGFATDRELRLYRKMNFEICGEAFVPPGCRSPHHPILLTLDGVLELSESGKGFSKPMERARRRSQGGASGGSGP